MSHHHTDSRLGLAIGAVMGLLNGAITHNDVIITVFLGIIGSTAGYFTTMFWNWLSDRFKK
jgi:uncharacterized membrane protein YeaQ/YmgE (transglycosylase-associated protein family)